MHTPTNGEFGSCAAGAFVAPDQGPTLLDSQESDFCLGFHEVCTDKASCTNMVRRRPRRRAGARPPLPATLPHPPTRPPASLLPQVFGSCTYSVYDYLTVTGMFLAKKDAEVGGFEMTPDLDTGSVRARAPALGRAAS